MILSLAFGFFTNGSHLTSSYQWDYQFPVKNNLICFSLCCSECSCPPLKPLHLGHRIQEVKVATHQQIEDYGSFQHIGKLLQSLPFQWHPLVETWELKQSFQLAQFMRNVNSNDSWWYTTTWIGFRYGLFPVKTNNDICHMYEPWRGAMHCMQTAVQLLWTMP